MKVVFNKIIPFGRNFYAINLFGVLFAKGPCSREMINHEEIHTAQMKELFYVPFYLFYVIEWFVRLALCRDSLKAYRTISFEREAYGNQQNFSYLNQRKRFAFLSYLKGVQRDN